MKTSAQNPKIFHFYVLLILAVFLNVGLWLHSSRIFPKWSNVPEPPSLVSMRNAFLLDDSFAFRTWAIALQNFGSIGNSQPLKNYNYAYLGDWFFLLDKLDPNSNFVPFLAAYYFSATQNPQQLPPVIKYLETVGARSGSEKWRWLAEAAYLARHKLNDMDEALRISKKLGSVYRPGMPMWTRNMEPLLRSELGDKQTAYLMMLEILKADSDKMSASEITSSVDIICHWILEPGEAAKNPLCKK